jgi:ABC-2 type transport system permease protein
VPLAGAREAALAMRRGRVSVLVAASSAGDSAAALSYDPSRPESRLARLVVEDAIERAAGRRDPVLLARRTRIERGARYIDFLIPGLIGMNLLGTGMWGVGFPIASSRQQKLLKRMLATPMRRRDYLLSFVFARLVWLVLEVAVIALFARWAFDVRVTGSWLAFAIVALIGAFAFSSLGLLVASRARTIEAVSGLMNFVMLPMWLLSGTFFSSARFPAWLQPFVKALPLTAVNDAMRAIYNESAGLATVRGALLLLALWTVVCFALALRMFRWE